MLPGGCFRGPGAQDGAFLPCSCADRAGEGPSGRGVSGAPSPASICYPAHSHTADPGILRSQEREKGFPKVISKGDRSNSSHPPLGGGPGPSKAGGLVGQDAGKEAAARSRQK